MSHLEHVGETKPGRRREKTAIRKILARSPVRRDKKVIWLLSGGGGHNPRVQIKKKSHLSSGWPFIYSLSTHIIINLLVPHVIVLDS